MADKRILLVDGNSIMNRAFFATYGRAPMSAPDGTPTGAVSGFFNTLLSVKDEYKPTDICVLFDLKAPTFRHKMSSDYKATRKPMMPDLAVQMPICKQILDLMGISRMELEGYEADDLIGTLSRLGEEEGDEVFILSGDHDDFQLISDKVKVIMPQSGKGKPPRVLYDRDLFVEENGVGPEVFVQVKALMGDNSDNIIGVEKVGPKTAFKLIADYGSIDGVLAHTSELSKGLAAKLDASHELLELNLKLCAIDRHVPVPFGVEATAFDDIKDKQGTHDKLAALGLKMLTKKLGLDDIKTSIPVSSDPEDTEISGIYNKFSEIMSNMKLVSGFDGVTCKDGDDVAVSFCDDKALVYMPGDSTVYYGDANSLCDVVGNCNDITPVAFCYKDASKVMTKALHVKSVFDVGICGYVFNMIDGAKPDFARLYECVFKVPYPIEDEGPKQLDLTAALFGESADETETKINTEAKKLILVAAIYEAQKVLISREKKEQLLYEIEFPLVVTLDAIERNGMHVSKDMLQSLHEEFSNKLMTLEQDIYETSGYEFNIGSPKQLSEILFDENKLNLPHGKKGKTGTYSTSIEELNRLRTYHPVIDMIIEWRGLSKLDSTYALGLQDKIREDNRIHTTFTQAMTNTGRLSSTDPNLQNIPVRSENGGRIRQCFTSPEGRILVDADYSQIELRLLASMSKDEVMCEAFRNGEDVHKSTAMKVFGVSRDEVTSRQRATAKTVNFAIVYGISEYGLSTDLDISYAEAAHLIKQYAIEFPGITGYLDSLKIAGEKLGYVETLFGRKRILSELKSTNKNVRSFGLRAAMNTPIQGTAADIIKIAMNKVYNALKEELPDSKLVMQVHDELIVECDEKDAQKAADLLKREMENAVELYVKLESDVHIGHDWLEAK
ncbi:MAG: DNA polymerase I [Saccharofermentans sp.]|nr:DNA polymerase I [Saccharofermentans sp.]